MSHRTDWFREAKWGVAAHYLAELYIDLKGSEEYSRIDEWNRMVNTFDVEALADQLATVGAGYFLMTVGQNSGYYCAPNATYDRLTGIAPSHCSRRDLMADLSDALAARDIRLLAYMPSNAPVNDAVACAKLQWAWSFTNGAHGGEQTGKRLAEFQLMWEEVIRDWSTHWGEKVAGWWFDGCYFADAMYLHSDTPNFYSFAAAARAGNANSIVAFNPGVKVRAFTDAEDYTAGEMTEPEKAECNGRWIVGEDGHREQFHVWSYLGPFWAQTPPRFSDEEASRNTSRIIECEGVMTWDVPMLQNGLIEEKSFAQLKTIGQAVNQIKHHTRTTISC